MKEIEATRLKLKCLEMVEGTNLKWWEVLTMVGCSETFTSEPMLCGPKNMYTTVLGIVEGKPVWEGDTLYNKITNQEFKVKNFTRAFHTYSWNPSKPKTVMVELPLDYVKNQAVLYKPEKYQLDPLSKACAEALETEKDQEHKRLCNCV